MIIPIVGLLIVGIFFIITHKEYVKDRMDGRYDVWKNVLSDINDGQLKDDKHKFGITGVGFGRFPFVFPIKHETQFQQAHNDPLEFIHTCGLIGGYLLLAGIFIMLGVGLFHSSSLIFSIALSFVGIFFCSLGSFPFQLGAHQFYAAILVGLLHNDRLLMRRS